MASILLFQKTSMAAGHVSVYSLYYFLELKLDVMENSNTFILTFPKLVDLDREMQFL